MKGAIKIFSFSGIPVYVHWSLSFILFLIAYMWVKEGFLYDEMIFSFLLTLSLFVCVVLHEFGHALTARRFDIDTQDIIITPIGGLARLKGLPRKAREEIWITIAGPLVNLVLIILLLPLASILPLEDFFEALMFDEPPPPISYPFQFLLSLIVLNAVLFLFNLLPIFPMDGGRIFRATMSLFIPFKRATLIAVRIGQVLAVIFFGLGAYMLEPIWCAMAIFVFISAQMELNNYHFEMKSLHQHTVPPIQAKASFEELSHLISYPNDTQFRILNQEFEQVGTISASSIKEAIKSGHQDALVVDWIARPQYVN